MISSQQNYGVEHSWDQENYVVNEEKRQNKKSKGKTKSKSKSKQKGMKAQLKNKKKCSDTTKDHDKNLGAL